MDRPLPNILHKIHATKEREVEALLSSTDEATLLTRARESLAANPPRDFFAAVSKPAAVPNLIAEVKKASPSKGLIREDFDPPAIAQAYEAGGASAISCLTDRDYFQGELGYLVAVREATKLPVLRKDFIIHPAQIAEARCAGADAVLLIARMLEQPLYEELYALTRELGMTALCEIHDEPDLEKTLAVEPRLIGINNRDLDTFVVDMETTFRLRALIPAEIPVVGESGIFTSEDMARLQAGNISAALVGESLMRQPDVTAATRALLAP
ncbi:MAG: indole-3-glycerol phosphate synthase TrpC [Planctomycetota bacterium]|jgi:indole-3-glycerol phosphate synthase